ncbi:MAG TPA: hypothetical protein VFZ85_13950 [Jiangellaceae bacterium]
MTTTPALRVARQVSRGFAPVIAIFLAIVIPLFMGIGVVSFITDGEGSVWEIAAAGAFKWFPFALAVLLTPALLPMYVTHGVTRHQFVAGAMLTLVAFAVAVAAIVNLGYAAESAIYRAVDRPHDFRDPHLFASWTEVPLVITEYALLLAALLAGGWLIGTLYYRLHWLWATLLIPAAMAPAGGAELLLQTSWTGSWTESMGWTRPSLTVALSVSTLLIGATLALVYALTRSVPIKLKAT